MRRHTGSTKRAEKAKEAWGNSLNSLQDVYRVFTKYTSGDTLRPGCPWGELPHAYHLRRRCLASCSVLAASLDKRPPEMQPCQLLHQPESILAEC